MPAPTRIGKYDIIEVLGRGGMGVVYKAKDPHLGRLVAIKMTGGVCESPDLVSRFFQEAQSTASLQHPNIVTVYELGDWGGNPYLVMEYLEGHSLDVIIASQRPLNLIDELDIMLDVCRGLDYAHQRKIIHRDIKPANIVVLNSGSVKLVDFGIAHIVGRRLTLPGQVIGSFNYMSPEQINSKPIDTRTDIFSAGIVLYQLLTKTLPFQAENTAATLMKIVNDPPPPLAQFLNVYPPELEPILLRALAKDRDERYQTVDDFAVDLRWVREQVRQQTVHRHLREAAALMEVNALSKAKDEVLQALSWDAHHPRATQLMREIQSRIEGRPVVREVTGDSGESSPDSDQSSLKPPKAGGDQFRRPSRLQECLQEVKQEVNSRRFASALEILKEAQDLDPDAPEVKELVRSVTAAKEVEKKRQALSVVRAEIQTAIRLEDYRGAIEKAASALEKFPADVELLRLKEISEQQRRDTERRDQIDQELAGAQKLLEKGCEEELIARLSQAVEKFGQDSRLDSLLRFVRENAARRKLEKHKSDSLQAAREQVARKDYSAAIRILQAARTDLKDQTEIENLLQHVSDLAKGEQRKTTIASAGERARSLIAAKAYTSAINLLETTLSEIPDEEEMEILLAHTRKEAAAHRRKLQSLLDSAERLLMEHKPDEAQKMLEAESASFSQEPNWQSLVDRARREAEASRQLQEAIAEARTLAGCGQYDAARKRLAECKSRIPGSTQLDAELARIQQLRVAGNSEAVEKVVEEAVKLNGGGEYESALEKLASVLNLLPDLPAILGSKYEEAQKVASGGIIQRARAEIQRYIAAGQFTKAEESLSRTSTNITVFKALSDLESALSDEKKRMAAAKRALEEAFLRLQKNEWQQAAELLKRELALPIRVVHLKAELVEQFFNAAECALKTGWRSCDELLKQFRALEPQHQIPTALLTRVADARREEAVSACLDRGKLLQLKGDLQGARREVSQLAAIYPNDGRLAEYCQRLDVQIAQEEEKAHREKVRRDQDMLVGDAIRRAEAETSLDIRATILGEALQKYPQDPRLQPQLNHVKELSHRISEMAQSARAQEQAGEYEVALAKWEALWLTYRHYPDLEQNIERVKKLREQARTLSRSKRLEKIEQTIAAFNYDEASDLLAEATAEFPWDAEFMSLQGSVEVGIKARNRAQKHVAAAQEAFARQKWEAGRKAVIKACQTAKEDRLVWHQAIRELVSACSDSRNQEPGFAQSSIRLLSELGSPFAMPKALLERGRGVEEQSSVLQSEMQGQSPEDGKSAGPGWIGRVRHAISGLGGTDAKASRPVASELEKTPVPVPELAQSLRPPATSSPPMPVAEAKPSWSGPAPENKSDCQNPEHPKVIEFPAAKEGWSREARPSATDAFMPGAVAPSLPDLLPSTSEPKHNPMGPGVVSPSIVRGSPEMTSHAAQEVRSGLQLRAGTKWPEETLRPIEKRLATIVGPVARVLVSKAAAQANNLDELLSLLAAKLPIESDRKSLLSAKPEFLATAVAQPGFDRGELTLNPTTISTANSGIDSQSLERAVQILARYVGPIASIWVKRTATRGCSLEEVYLVLAERVEESKRAQFLKECGLSSET